MKTKTIIASALLATVYAASADITSVTFEGAGASTVDLTSEGTTDWIMLGRDGAPAGLANRDEKAGVDAIGAVTVTGTQDSWPDHPSRFDWTDGDTTGTGILTGDQELGNWEAKPEGTAATTLDQALTFSVSGLAVGEYSMMLYTGSYSAAQLLTATMGGSSLTATHDLSNDITSYSVDFEILDGADVLDIAFSRNDTAGNQYSNVSISAVTIAAVPEPATLGLIATCSGALLFIRRRFMI